MALAATSVPVFGCSTNDGGNDVEVGAGPTDDAASTGASAGNAGAPSTASGGTSGTRAPGGGGYGGASGSAGSGGGARGGGSGTGGGGGGMGSVGPGCNADGGMVPAKGTPGVWEKVTPSDMFLGVVDGQCGAQDVLVDPVRPSDVYSFACAGIPGGAVWKSTDYGLTWTRISKNSIGSTFPCATTGEFCPGVNTGPWRTAIVPDTHRDPHVPPTFYEAQSFGGGLHKSTDGGLNWTNALKVGADNNDVCHLAVDPWNLEHIVVGSHSGADDHLYESIDGGKTWTKQATIASTYSDVQNPDMVFVDARTLLVTYDGDAGLGPGTWRGVKSEDTWPWTWTWTHVSDQQRFHGMHQFLIEPKTQAIFSGGAFGIQKSTDAGLTWTTVSKVYSGDIVGTATMLYSSTNYASQSSVDPRLQHATLDGTSWTSDPTPSGMTNGAHWAAVTCDGTHYVVLMSNWLSGLWRYLEP